MYPDMFVDVENHKISAVSDLQLSKYEEFARDQRCSFLPFFLCPFRFNVVAKMLSWNPYVLFLEVLWDHLLFVSVGCWNV